MSATALRQNGKMPQGAHKIRNKCSKEQINSSYFTKQQKTAQAFTNAVFNTAIKIICFSWLLF